MSLAACRSASVPAKFSVLARLPALLLALLLMLGAAAGQLWGAGPRVLAEGERPADARLAPLKDLNGYFPLEVPPSRQAWEIRAAQVKRQVLVSLGLWPLPKRTPLEPVRHGRINQGDYLVEKVYFQSMPGFYVTGNLYLPAEGDGPFPGILCPHGHWASGRFYDLGEQAVRRAIVDGAERFENGGRSALQARCVQLARMGCVVFHYDMIGYADSTQISYELAHRFAKQRPEMNHPEGWGLFSPRAESHLQSIMGLQTWNSIRALDFLTQLSAVDPERLAVTGASGGGTQTFLLAAVDPRLAAAFPAVMVSTAMQGGCTCENASLLRVGTGNIELAGLFAPKPLALTAADDWTKEMETKGFPELKALYGLYGKPDHVRLHANIHFGHNYNHVSRAAMYDWFNRHLKLGHSAPVLERDYPRLSQEEMTVWNADHPQPPGGPEFERRLLADWHQDSQRQLSELVPDTREALPRFREVVGGAVDVLIGRRLPQPKEVEFDQRHKQDRGDYLEIAGLVKNNRHGESCPVVFLYPKQWNGEAVIWLHEQGKAGLYAEDGPRGEVAKLVSAGIAVMGADLLYQGEFLADGKPYLRTRKVNTPREAAAYTFGYNHALFARRVHDVLNLITFVSHHDYRPEKVTLVGLGPVAGPWAAAARAQAGDAVSRAAIDTGGFRFQQVDRLDHPQFLPGGAKYGDLPGMLALSAPDSLWLAGEGPQPPAWVAQAYRHSEGRLTVSDTAGDAATQAAVAWLLGANAK